MRVETVRVHGAGVWEVGLVGVQSERFRKVTLTSRDLEALAVQESLHTYAGDVRLLRLGLQAYMLGIAHEFDPYFGLSISRVDPLPHQLEAVYDYLPKFVKRQSARAAAQSDDPRARAVGFLMALYQRRLASSTYAVRCSLQNRASRLAEGLQRAQTLARQPPPVLPDPEELEEMEEGERDRLERLLEAITLAGNAEQVHEEIAELRRLAQQAHAVEEASTEAKLARLKDLLQTEGFFDDPEQRLLLFTEFKDTLDYLVDRLKAWGFRVGTIHGGMRPSSRDDPGTRLFTEQAVQRRRHSGPGGN